jgi:hypothetical protein
MTVAVDPFHEAQLNTFAIRTFRDTADRDYVAARMAYRAHLVQQFQWSGLHCLEKYAKGICMINRVPAKSVKHEVSALLALMAKGPFVVELSDGTLEYIQRLEETARFRYYEVSYYSERFEISQLDRAVSELRRYCQPLNVDAQIDDAPKKNLLASNLARIRHAKDVLRSDTCIMSGWLEEVLAKPDHAAHEPLDWQNLFFSKEPRESVSLVGYWESGNAPLYLHPELLDDVERLIFLPSDVRKAWREELVKRGQAGGSPPP